MPKLLPVLSCCLILACCWIASFVVAAEPAVARVEFELYTVGNVSPQVSQVWFQTLTKLGVKGLRIRASQAADQPQIVTGGTAQLPSFRVIGALTDRGELQVPGGKFTSRDGAAIINWIGTLENHGVTGVTEAQGAFGLSKQQLEAVHTDLSGKVDFATKGQPAIEVLRKLAVGKIHLVIEPELERAVGKDDPVRDELQGLSRGTALAALLRPAGGVLVPRKPAKANVELALINGSEVRELWPIGWSSDEQLGKQIPKMLEMLNAEIDGVTAAEAIAAVHARIEAPLLFDHNNLALQKVNLEQPIKLQPGRTYYAKLLKEILANVKCKYEVRVDENGQAFVWITTK